MSSIVTFYSYKGGVGRSMALANVAVLLARRGLNVLAVDWDLEAPGLERYFSYFTTTKTGNGLLPFLIEERDKGGANFDAYTSFIDCDSTYPITLLASGRDQDDSYSLKLEAFDWGEFFAKGGGAFFERLREQWRSKFDIILIDSRTGLSDTGGICTIQLPDAVVAMFTANHQSLYGVRDVMRLAQKARQSLAYDRMPLSVLPLPSRWGTQEFQETQIWLDRVVEAVQEFYADWLPSSINPRQVSERIKVPHHSYFGFGERLAVAEQGVSDPTGLGFVYDKVAAFLASDFKDLTSLIGEVAKQEEFLHLPSAPMRPSPAARVVDSVDPYEYDVFVSYDHSSMEAAIEIVEALKRQLNMLRDVETRFFIDLRELSLGSDWTSHIHKVVEVSKVMLVLLTPRYFDSRAAKEELLPFLDSRKLDVKESVLPVIVRGDQNQIFKTNNDLSRNLRHRSTLVDLAGESFLATAKLAPGRRPSEWDRKISLIASHLEWLLRSGV